MKRVVKYSKIFFALALLGIITGVAIRAGTVISRKTSPKVASVPVAPTNIVVKPTRTRILFTGDINLGRCIAERTLRSHTYSGNYNYPFEYVAEKLRGADITVGSLDGSLSDESAPMPCPASMNLIGPTHMAEGLQFAGFDVITVATNHIKDCGEKGFECDNKALLDTINTLQAAEIQPVGAGKSLSESRLPVVVERGGIRFAFLGVDQIEERVWAAENTPGAAPLSQTNIVQIKADIISAKQIADVVIVLPQWGVEYAAAPEEIQRDWAKEFINAGASLVIGNHPHITQPMEIFSDKLIFYALGNFVFDQEQSFRRESIVVEVNFIGAEIESWQLHPVSINYYTFQSHWAEDEEANYILARAKEE
jgi:poly-gamma-glutamate synthesis protein (capsule biosynthesis protein)